MLKRILKFLFKLVMLVGLLGTIAVLSTGIYFYNRFTSDLPRIDRLSDYRPKAVSTIHSASGTPIAEIYEERRYPVEFSQVPQLVRNAFLAAEDANFYSHPGIDLKGIIRAFWVNIKHKSAKQGASTITQQIVKSLLLTREKTFERKVKEAILSYRLENYLKKDEIFSIYLNEVFLGSGAYGIKAAAKVHFHKELGDLSIAEAAYMAGLPQKPSELSKLENRAMAISRQHYVLEQMLSHQMITPEQYEQAKQEKLTVYPQEEQTIFAAPYFSGHVIKLLKERAKEFGLLSETAAQGGLQIHTTVDVLATEIAERALQRGLREIDKRQGWRGPIKHITPEDVREFAVESLRETEPELKDGRIYKAVVLRILPDAQVEVRLGNFEGQIDLKKSSWAKQLVRDGHHSAVDPAKLLKIGDVVEVSLAQKADSDKQEKVVPLKLDQTPELEASFVLINAQTGEVKVIVGGYDYQRNQFNRATQAARQPGSSFKPFVYLAAVESLGFTPSTIVPDSPISLPAGDGKMWTPSNFDHEFLGPITLRTALQRSRNVVSVYLIQRLGVERVIQSAKKLGIISEIAPNLSIALGTSEVKLIEMVRAYGAFATGGYLADELIISSITERDGKKIYEQFPKQQKVIDEDSAFIVANMMKGVVERGTATVLKQLGKPVAGKTGTTNDQMDAWFIGYTPQWVAGVWVGYDVKRNIGRYETGGKAAAPIFLYFMQEFLADAPAVDFDIPDGVIPVTVNLDTGKLTDAEDPRAFVDYFKSGSEPQGGDEESSIPKDYLSNEDF